ncbi:hypothetical protein [Rubripirellula reticaptiva]|uniref:Thioredoxin domain-containing protein n=1 Tax=Rubripirellula reticaptiva TaxID=2528013 RepID=A0A5C6F9V7_9BACT|nr:hypothetical protein [Rubripirellula reticaptiva]TWU57662.1 hypothetical protein Poly59_05690 [Rubripirellula reticaptiva]
MRFFWLSSIVFCLTLAAVADDLIFSGPQVGEPVVPFEARIVFGEDAGNHVNVIKGIDDGPVMLVFVQQVTRPSIALTRLLGNYASTKKDEGLQCRLIFLTSDPTETEAWLRRARGALPEGVSPMISMDGIEGPGAYGLHRKMTLTILIANQGRVVANFPLVQPSIQADAVKIGQAIEKVLGRKQTPSLAEMGFEERQMGMRGRADSSEQEGIYRQMMSPVIQKTATPEDVLAAAEQVEQFAAKNPWFKQRVHKATNLIVDGGKLSNYGTLSAQNYLKKWADEFAPDNDEDSDENGGKPVPASDDSKDAESS